MAVYNGRPGEGLSSGHGEREMKGVILVTAVAMIVAIGCRRGDPADKMIGMVDRMPPEKRPVNWQQTRSLMERKAPAVGQPAPDFTLKTLDGTKTISLSAFHDDRPRVLIFGSYT